MVCLAVGKCMCFQPAGPDGSPVICFTLFCLITTINSLFLQLITNLFHPPYAKWIHSETKKKTKQACQYKHRAQDVNVSTHTHTLIHTNAWILSLFRLRGVLKFKIKKNKAEVAHSDWMWGCGSGSGGGGIPGWKALHYVLLSRYNHHMAITPRRHQARALTRGLMHGKCEAPATADNKQRH